VKAPLAWLREFAPVPDDAQLVAARLAACGLEIASIERDVLDVDVTANRPDCLSVYGLAREAAAACGVAFPSPQAAPGRPAPPAGDKAPLPVSINDAGCGRYALAAADVTVAPSPDWLAARLAAAGVRPINNVVDVTNYVMLELGHPMHAFDLAALAGPAIRVRRARAGEELTTLDGERRTLDETMLVIADRDRAVALAGLMGGAASEVSAGTTEVALESAWFQPASVRATSRRLGLKTEASIRFERGADLTAPVRAIERALELLAQIGAGRQRGAIVDVYPQKPATAAVPLRRERIARLLGRPVPDADVERILRRLEFEAAPAPGGWTVKPPPFRVDVAREADLIEEVGRHWGFDRLPATFPPLRVMPPEAAPGVRVERAVRRLLGGAGLHEAVTFTFIERAAAEAFANRASIVEIANPLSEKFAVLRPSLLPGLLDALVYNRRRGVPDVRLFETGSAFSPAGETRRAAWIMTGRRVDHWTDTGGRVDFFDAQGVAEVLGEAAGTPITAEPADDRPWLVSGQAARLVVGSPAGPVVLGVVGRIRPDLAASRGLGQPDAVVGGEVDLAPLSRIGRAAPRPVEPLPRHPAIVRDVSIFVDERLPAAAVRGTIRANAPPTLVALREFDRYQGRGVPPGRVSLSVRLTFRDRDRTLTDVEVQHAVDAIVRALVGAHGAELRSAAAT
jgi:phenylalanyl-tRNA synthetase beta chain